MQEYLQASGAGPHCGNLQRSSRPLPDLLKNLTPHSGFLGHRPIGPDFALTFKVWGVHWFSITLSWKQCSFKFV